MFYEKTSAGFIIRVRVTPNSSKSGANGIFTDSNMQDFLKVNLNAVPEKGKANQELIKFLSKILKQNKSSFSILSGETDRYKRLQLNTSDLSQTEMLLQQLEKENDSTNS